MILQLTIKVLVIKPELFISYLQLSSGHRRGKSELLQYEILKLIYRASTTKATTTNSTTTATATIARIATTRARKTKAKTM